MGVGLLNRSDPTSKGNGRMNVDKKSFNLIREYTGIDRKTLFTFMGLVLIVFVVVTGIYVAIFGFNTWATNMEQAGSMMIANFDVPVNGNTMVANFDDRTPGVPIAGRVIRAPAAVQYSCPNCGAVGLPLWGPNGTPRCPNCRGVMNVQGKQGVLPCPSIRRAAAP